MPLGIEELSFTARSLQSSDELVNRVLGPDRTLPRLPNDVGAGAVRAVVKDDEEVAVWIGHAQQPAIFQQIEEDDKFRLRNVPRAADALIPHHILIKLSGERIK